MTMSRMELAKKCQKIEKAGGDVLEYLRTEQGCYSLKDAKAAAETKGDEKE